MTKYINSLFFIASVLFSSVIIAEDLTPSGTITIEETQVKLLLGGSEGSGTFTKDGNTHSFIVSGMSLGGIGVQKIKLEGEVYNLNDLSDLAGDYASFEVGATVGTLGKDAMWMKNSSGVKLELKTTDSKGLAVSLSIEGFTISQVN